MSDGELESWKHDPPLPHPNSDLTVKCDRCNRVRCSCWINAFHGDCGGSFRADEKTRAIIDARFFGKDKSMSEREPGSDDMPEFPEIPVEAYDDELGARVALGSGDRSVEKDAEAHLAASVTSLMVPDVPKYVKDQIVQQNAEDASMISGAFEVPGTLLLTDAQKKILTQRIPEEDIDIKPTGELFAAQVRYRRILNDAFGPGAWGMRPVGAPVREEQPTRHVAQEWALYVNGRFVSQAWGDQDFVMGSHQLTYATALEGAKSTALTRCCKDLGIASELWDRHFTETWKQKNCETYLDFKGRSHWRRKDAAGTSMKDLVITGGGTVTAQATERADQPKATPTPAPVRSTPPSASQGPSQIPGVVCAIVDVRSSEGVSQKTGEPWKRYDIEDEHGEVHTTFDETMADLASHAKSQGRQVRIVSKESRYNNPRTGRRSRKLTGLDIV